jgi:hypothetical protein
MKVIYTDEASEDLDMARYFYPAYLRAHFLSHISACPSITASRLSPKSGRKISCSWLPREDVMKALFQNMKDRAKTVAELLWQHLKHIGFDVLDYVIAALILSWIGINFEPRSTHLVAQTQAQTP